MGLIELDEDVKGVVDHRGLRFVHVKPSNIEQCRHFLASNTDWNVMLVSSTNEPFESLDFLLSFQPFEYLIINASVSDTNGLSKLAALVEIEASFTRDIILGDISCLQNLKVLDCEFNKSLRLPKSLDSLILRKAKSTKTMDLFDILPLELSSLKLIQTNLTTLSGIERISKLSDLEVSYSPKLIDIKSLAALKKIQKLEFENCKKSIDIETISLLPKITELKINKCGALESIHFIKALSSLKRLTFLEIKIANRDLTPLLSHPRLEYVGFSGNQYSHTYSQINNELAIKHGRPERY